MCVCGIVLCGLNKALSNWTETFSLIHTSPLTYFQTKECASKGHSQTTPPPHPGQLCIGSPTSLRLSESGRRKSKGWPVDWTWWRKRSPPRTNTCRWCEQVRHLESCPARNLSSGTIGYWTFFSLGSLRKVWRKWKILNTVWCVTVVFVSCRYHWLWWVLGELSSKKLSVIRYCCLLCVFGLSCMESVIRYCCLLCVFGLSCMKSVIRYCCLLCVFGLSSMESVIRYCCLLCVFGLSAWSLSSGTVVHCVIWIVHCGVCHWILVFTVCFGLSSMESVIRYCCLLCVFGLSCMKSVIRYCCSLCDLDCPLWSLSLDTGVYCLFWIVQHGVCHQVLLFVVCFWIVLHEVCHQVLLFIVWFGLSTVESVIGYWCLLSVLDCPAWSLSSGAVVCCVFLDCPAWSLSSGTVVHCVIWIVHCGVCHWILVFTVCFGLSSMESVIRYCCLLCVLGLSSEESVIRYSCLLCVLDCPMWSLSSGTVVVCFGIVQQGVCHQVLLFIVFLDCPTWSLSSGTVIRYCCLLCVLDYPAWSLSSGTVVYCVIWIVQCGVCHWILLFIVCFGIVQHGVCHQVLLFIVSCGRVLHLGDLRSGPMFLPWISHSFYAKELLWFDLSACTLCSCHLVVLLASLWGRWSSRLV